jgi:hypothetical protein
MSTMPKFPGPAPKQQILLEAWRMAAPNIVFAAMVEYFAKEESEKFAVLWTYAWVHAKRKFEHPRSVKMARLQRAIMSALPDEEGGDASEEEAVVACGPRSAPIAVDLASDSSDCDAPLDPLVEEELLRDFSAEVQADVDPAKARGLEGPCSSSAASHSVVIPSSQEDEVLESSQEFPVDSEALQDLLEDPASLVHPADHRGLFAMKKAPVQRSGADAPKSHKRKSSSAPAGVAGVAPESHKRQSSSAPAGVAGDAAKPGVAGDAARDAPMPKQIGGVRCIHRDQRGCEFYQMMRQKEVLGQITVNSIPQPAIVAAMDVWQAHAASGKTKAELKTVKTELIALWMSVDVDVAYVMDFEGAARLFQRLEPKE